MNDIIGTFMDMKIASNKSEKCRKLDVLSIILQTDFRSFFRYSVRLGEWDTETEQDCQTVYNFQSCNDAPLDVEVERAFAHSGYSDSNVNRYHDIALVKLKEHVEFSSESTGFLSSLNFFCEQQSFL